MGLILKIKGNNKLTDDTYQIVGEVVGLEKFFFEEGQFVMLAAQINGENIKRAYSISSTNDRLPEIELTIKRVKNGLMSNYVCDLKEGDEIDIFGPYGKFLWNLGNNRKKVFVATGCGIAPLKSIIERQIASEKEILLFWGNQCESRVAYKDYFQILEKNFANFKFINCLSREVSENYPYKGRVNQIMESFDLDYDESDFYIAGSTEMINDLRNFILDKGGREKSIFVENISK